MAFYPCIQTSGSDIEKVLDDGIISTTSSYATATFDPPSSEYIIIFFKCTGILQDNTKVYKVSDLSSSESSFTIYLNTDGTSRSVQMRISDHSIRATSYAGDFVEITATIWGLNP